LAEARKKADALRKEVASGVNPVLRKRNDRASAADRTFKALADRYLQEHAARFKRPRSAEEDRRNLKLHVLPKWERRPFASIRRRDVIELVEGLISQEKPTAANRVQALISKMFSFALDAELIDAHPCHGLKKRAPENARDRVLTDEELRLFWNGVAEPARARRIGLGLRLILLTGARRIEMAGINRLELCELENAAKAAWFLPSSRTKNKREHLIPLPPLARETLQDLLAMTGKDESFLLPTRSKKRKGPIPETSVTQAMDNFTARLKRQESESKKRAKKGAQKEISPKGPVTSWLADPPNPHDLRRTLETRMAAMGVAKDIRDRVLNHISRDVGAKHYDRHDYIAEKRAALTKWDERLRSILRLPADGAQIVVFQPRKARRAKG
jgi:integrase